MVKFKCSAPDLDENGNLVYIKLLEGDGFEVVEKGTEGSKLLKLPPTHCLRFTLVDNNLLMTYAVAKNDPNRNEVDSFSAKKGHDLSNERMDHLLDRMTNETYMDRTVGEVTSPGDLSDLVPWVIIDTLEHYISMACLSLNIKESDNVKLIFRGTGKYNKPFELRLELFEHIRYKKEDNDE
tara:strand:+ start:117 stop:659 length:543 start_codon:yes stop_codon:yes gene_type:complete